MNLNSRIRSRSHLSDMIESFRSGQSCSANSSSFAINKELGGYISSILVPACADDREESQKQNKCYRAQKLADIRMHCKTLNSASSRTITSVQLGKQIILREGVKRKGSPATWSLDIWFSLSYCNTKETSVWPPGDEGILCLFSKLATV